MSLSIIIILFLLIGLVLAFIYIEPRLLKHKVKNNNECLANVNSGLKIGDRINNYVVVGLYKKNFNDGTVGNNFCFDSIVIGNGNTLLTEKTQAAFKFTSEAEEYFKEFDYNIVSLMDYQSNYVRKEHQSEQITVPIMFAVLLLLVVVLTYFSNRSKIIGEIQNIGVLRSIGKSKASIINQKIFYNIIQTSFSSVIGYAVAWVFYYYFANAFGAITNSTPDINVFMLILGIVIIYLINVFVGILPSVFLLKNTPSEIISKYDI